MITTPFSIIVMNTPGPTAESARFPGFVAGLEVDASGTTLRPCRVLRVAGPDLLVIETPVGPAELRLLNIWSSASPSASMRLIELQAHAYLQTLLQGRSLHLAIEPDRQADGQGRLLAYAQTGPDTIVNVEMVRRGLSPYFFQHGPSRRFHDEFVAAERRAYEERAGVWGDPNLRRELWSLRQDWAAQDGLSTPRLGAGRPTEDIGWLGRKWTDEALGGAIVIALLLTMAYFKSLTRRTAQSGRKP